jgi:glucose dehydrogenase
MLKHPAAVLAFTTLTALLPGAALPLPSASPAETAPADGAALYGARCAACHDHPAERIPSRIMLSTYRTPEEIIAALTNGVMRQQAAGLSADDIRSLAVYLTGKQPIAVQSDPMANACLQHGPLQPAAGDWSGWGRDLANTRLQPQGGLAASDVPRLELKWAFAFPGRSAFGQPVVVGDRLYAGGIGGRVYSLDARTGCTHWSYDAGAPVRTATLVAPLEGTSPVRYAAYFGDDKGNVHAVDAATGTRLWSVRVDTHPVARILGTPQYYRGRLYVPVSSGEEVAAANEQYACCTFRGSIAALDAASGRLLWQSYVVRETPQPDTSQRKRRAALRSCGRRDLLGTDDRREARPALRRDGRFVHEHVHRFEQCSGRTRPRHRRAALDHAGAAQRRLGLRLCEWTESQLPGAAGTGLRLRVVARADRDPGRSRDDHRRCEIRHRLRDRPRRPGTPDLAGQAGAGQPRRRHPVGTGRGR